MFICHLQAQFHKTTMFHNTPLNIVAVTFVLLPAKLPPWSHSVCRNYLYKLFPLSDMTEKKFFVVKSGEHRGHMFLEMRQSPKTAWSTFTVSLTVCEVAPSCWNQRSCSSSSNKATNCCTKISPSTVDWKTGLPQFSYIIQHTKQQFAQYDAILHIR